MLNNVSLQVTFFNFLISRVLVEKGKISQT